MNKLLEVNLMDFLGHGKANARTAAYLSTILHVDRRIVLDEVSRLRKDSKPVGTSRGRGGGIYIMASYAEKIETLNTLRNQVEEMQKVLAGLEKAEPELLD